MQASYWMNAREAKQPLLAKNIIIAMHVFILLSAHTDSRCAEQLSAQPCSVSRSSSCAVSGSSTSGLCMVILLTHNFSISLELVDVQAVPLLSASYLPKLFKAPASPPYKI